MPYGEIRIIAGQLRGRKIRVLNCPDLRPTPDRVRERLFNWLSPYLHNAACLDLFCGTGVLGIEALSRGAATLVSIDASQDTMTHLSKTAEIFQLTHRMNLIHAQLPNALLLLSSSFNVVFIDPPYQLNLGLPTLHALLERQLLKPNALIYIESHQPLSSDELPTSCFLFRSGHIGHVFHHVLRFEGKEHA